MVGVCYNLHYRDEAWDSVFFLGHLSSKQAEHEPAQPYSSKFKFHLISITCLSNNTVVALFGFPALTYYLVCFTSWIHFCFLAKWIKNFNARTKVQEWHRFFFFLRGRGGNFFYCLKNLSEKNDYLNSKIVFPLWHYHITNSTDMNLSKPWETVKDRGAWSAAVHGVTKSWTLLTNWKTSYSTIWSKELVKVY